MSNATALPSDLYKINLELQVKLIKLLQENSQHWLDFGHHLIDDGIAGSDSTVQNLLKAGNWQKLALLPTETFWSQAQQRFGDSQALAQIGLKAQTAYAGGLQEALRTWQKETLDALAGVTQASSSEDAPWSGLFKPWEQFLSAARRSGDEPPADKALTKANKGTGE